MARTTLCMILPLALLSCAPEGEALLTLGGEPDNPCTTPGWAVGQPINTGEDAMAALACLNKDGQLDWIQPLMDTLAAEPGPTGGSLLDAWVEAAKGGLPAGAGGDPAATLADQLDLAVANLDNGAMDARLTLWSQSIEEGIWSEQLHLAQLLAAELKALSDDERREWRRALQRILCHSTSPQEGCQSPLRDALRGKATLLTKHSPGDTDYPFPSDEDAVEKAAWFLYADGDVARAERAQRNFARGIAKMSEERTDESGRTLPPLGYVLLTETLPRVYGDDLSTPWFYEGYPHRDVTRSALYGLLRVVSDVSVRQALVDGNPEAYRLITEHFPFDVRTVGETSYPVTTCSEGGAALMDTEPHGVGQLLRALHATSWDYDDPALPERCGFGISKVLPWVSSIYELSGTKNMAVIILEIFGQIPTEQAQEGADLLNHEPLIALVNAMCAWDLKVEDSEALQMSVYMPSSIAYGQRFMRAFAHAGRLEDVAEFLQAFYGLGIWCDWTDLAKLSDDPLMPTHPAPTVDPIFPSEGVGPEAHDIYTQPMLTAMMDVATEGRWLLPPLARALASPAAQDHLAALLLAQGALAYRPDTALLQQTLIDVAAARTDPLAQRVQRWATTLEDGPLVDAMIWTLASPAVVDALTLPQPGTGRSVLDEIKRKIDSGGVLAQISAVVRALDEIVE